MADRRMLWKRVSTSRKVNRLSLKAALLWTWAVPWFDVKGFLEVEPDIIKDQIVPRRKDFEEDEIVALVDEIFKSGLWVEYELCGKRVAFDLKFKEMQTVRESHESKSLFHGIAVLRQTKDRPKTDPLQTKDGGSEVKGSEVKQTKKRPEAPDPALEDFDPPKPSPSAAPKDKNPEDEKTAEEIGRVIDRLYRSKAFPKAPAFAKWAAKQGCNPKAILHCMESIEKHKPLARGKDPWAYGIEILKVENGNYNEADHLQQAEKKKNDLFDVVEDLKKRQEQLQEARECINGQKD